MKDFIAPVPTEINTCRTVELPNVAYADATNPGNMLLTPVLPSAGPGTFAPKDSEIPSSG